MNSAKFSAVKNTLFFITAITVTMFAGVFTAQKVKSYTGFAVSSLLQTAKTSGYYSYYKMAFAKEDYDVFLGLINSVLLTNNSRNIELINDLPDILSKTYNTGTYNVHLTNSYLSDNTLVLEGSCPTSADAANLAASLEEKYDGLYLLTAETQNSDSGTMSFSITLTPID